MVSVFPLRSQTGKFNALNQNASGLVLETQRWLIEFVLLARAFLVHMFTIESCTFGQFCDVCDE